MLTTVIVVLFIFTTTISVAVTEKSGKTSFLRHSDSFSDLLDELEDDDDQYSIHRLLVKIIRELAPVKKAAPTVAGKKRPFGKVKAVAKAVTIARPKRAAGVNGMTKRLAAQSLTDAQAKDDKKKAGTGVNPASSKGPGFPATCSKATLKSALTAIHKKAGSSFTGNTAVVDNAAKHIKVEYHFDAEGRPSYAEVTFKKDWVKCDSSFRDPSFQSKFTDYFVKGGFTAGTMKGHPQVLVGGHPIEAGHIVGAQFCGPNNLLNYVPQSKASNIGTWARGEDALAKYLAARGKNCEVKVKMSYSYGTAGPTVTHANSASTTAIKVNECLKLIWPTNLKIEILKTDGTCPPIANKVLANTSHQLRLLDILNELGNEDNDLGNEGTDDYDENDSLQEEFEALLK